MATVRMTLATAGLVVCAAAFADGTAGETVPSAESAVAAVAPVVSRKAVKTASSSKVFVIPKSPASGRMQVVEPKSDAPMSPARESKAWQKSHSRGLTDAQKQAFRERKESMEGMIAVIKEKRKALRDAKPEERAALARELHSLILEKDPAAALATSSPATARVAPAVPENARAVEMNGADANSAAAAQASQREEAKKAKAEEAAERRRKRNEEYQEQQRKKD